MYPSYTEHSLQMSNQSNNNMIDEDNKKYLLKKRKVMDE